MTGLWGCDVGKFFSTLVTVVVAVAVSAGIWIVANLIFNQAQRRWKLFNAHGLRGHRLPRSAPSCPATA